MRAGPLRHRIAVQSKTETQSPRGGIVETWNTVETRWGSIEPLRAREVLEAQQVDARLSHRVIMRYIPILTNQHRLVFNGTRIFHIHSVRHLQERSRTTEILCMEEV